MWLPLSWQMRSRIDAYMSTTSPSTPSMPFTASSRPVEMSADAQSCAKNFASFSGLDVRSMHGCSVRCACCASGESPNSSARERAR
jgi:hypothetical protein